MSDSEENDILALSPDFVPPAPIKPAGICAVDFNGLLSPPLQLHEDLKNGCGGQLWPAGMVLSRYLLRQHRASLAGQSILELGAGGGLVGLAVAAGCSGARVWVTDQSAMVPLMARNIALNGLGERVVAAEYEWGTPAPESVPARPDVVLAADCVYFEPAFPLLLATLREVVGEGTVCYFCFKRRRRADLGFMKSARKVLCVEEVGDDPERDVYGREKVFLYRITKKSG